MKSVSLKPMLLAGLRKSYTAGRNEPGLLRLVNMSVSPSGLYPYEPVLNPISIAASVGVPAVQVFRGPNYIIAFGNDNKVYTLLDDDNNWAETEITDLINPDDTDATLTLTSGDNMWQFAAFQQGWIATNGSCALYAVREDEIYLDTITYPKCVCSFRGRVFWGGVARHWLRFNEKGYSLDMWGQTLQPMTDSWIGWCTIQGRDIMQHVFPERALSGSAGRVEEDLLDNGYFFFGSTGWTAGTGWTYTVGPNRMVASAANGTLKYRVTVDEAGDGYSNRIELDITRSAGSVTVTVEHVVLGLTVTYVGEQTLDTSGQHVLYFEQTVRGYAYDVVITGSGFTGTVHGLSVKRSPEDADTSSWEDQARLLQSGFSPASDQGDILCIKALHDHVVVYGENFIAAYSPVSAPVPTFGKVSIASFGVAGRCAVGGDLNQHLLVDGGGKLWKIDNQLQMTPLGYEEFFREFIVYGGASKIAIGYDDNSEVFYISCENADDLVTMLLTNGGLSVIETEFVHSICGTRGSTTYGDTTGYASAGVDDAFRLLTDSVDFDSASSVTIKRVQIIGDGVEGVTVSIYQKLWWQSYIKLCEGQQCNSLGEVYPDIDVSSCKIALYAANYANVRIYDVIVTYEDNGRMNSKSAIARR